MSDVDPILVAGDDGEVLDETDDGAVVCIEGSIESVNICSIHASIACSRL
jgi:hypothetical protein